MTKEQQKLAKKRRRALAVFLRKKQASAIQNGKAKTVTM